MKKLTVLLMALVLCFAFAACSTNSADDAVEDGQEMVDDVENGAEDVVDDAGDAVKDGADAAGDAVEDGAERVKDAVDSDDNNTEGTAAQVAENVGIGQELDELNTAAQDFSGRVDAAKDSMSNVQRTAFTSELETLEETLDSLSTKTKAALDSKNITEEEADILGNELEKVDTLLDTAAKTLESQE